MITPGNQYEFFRQVKLTNDGKIPVDVEGLPQLINLLSNLIIMVGDIADDTDEIKNNVEELNKKIKELNNGCQDLVDKVNTSTEKPSCRPEHTLIGNHFYNRKGQIVTHRPKLYNWSGWNIVGSR